MQDERKKTLCQYRLNNAEETYTVAQDCFKGMHFKDCVNRSYYAVFYALKAVLALEGVDFKRHKDVVAYFNRHYVAADVFKRDYGRKIAKLQQIREKSDYDDFYITSSEEAEMQLENTREIIDAITIYLNLL
ncbi:MAG: HEPN domain-containing protein [Eubacteriales bacterium]